jgi:hypothetical protein
MARIVKHEFVRAEMPYFGETLILVVNKTTGKESVLIRDQWGEPRTAMFTTGITKAVASLREQISVQVSSI